MDKLDQEGKLTWHDNGIPEDEIWVKVGGGGETMVEVVLKFVVRLQTQKDPIPVITHTIAMVFVKDSYDVLSKILGKMQKGIQSLKREIGGTKSFVGFFFWRLRFFFSNLLDCQGQMAPIRVFGALQHQKKCNKERLLHFQEPSI